jgi:hypothetical protein
VGSRELHTGLSQDKFALCSPRTGHPGQPVPAKPERKKKWKAVCPVAGTPTGQIRTAQTGSARPFPDRSAMAEAGPSTLFGRRRRRPRAKIVAGRAPKGMPRAKSVQPAAVNLPREPPRPKKGKGITDSTIEAWKGMYSWVLWFGNQRSEGGPLPQCTAAPSTRRIVRVQVVRWARGGRGHRPPTRAARHLPPGTGTWRPCSTSRPGWAARALWRAWGGLWWHTKPNRAQRSRAISEKKRSIFSV